MEQFTEEDMRGFLLMRAGVEGSQSAAAKVLEISIQYFSDIICGRRGVSEAVAKKMGYERTVMFTRTPKPKGRKS